jgi:hypothetical protein
MLRRLACAGLLAPSLLTVAACSTPTRPAALPEQNTRIVYPAMPPTVCLPVPAAPAVTAGDTDWSLYKHARDDAGDDCRAKLEAVDQVVKAWPKQEGN